MSDFSADAVRSERSIPLPMRISISMRAGFVLAIANIICVIIFAYAWTHVRSEAKVISVTGSARKPIVSDLVNWSAKVSVIEPELPKSYENLKRATDKTIAFIRNAGVPQEQIKLSSIEIRKRREKDEKGNEKEKVIAYELGQNIEVTSGDVNRVAEIARNVTALIKDDVLIESNAPLFIYTKLADMKIAMLAEATKDAQTRALQIASNSGSSLGPIVDARMGVMQINPVHSYETSSLGNNDTSSLEKEITATVTARFSLD